MDGKKSTRSNVRLEMVADGMWSIRIMNKIYMLTHNAEKILMLTVNTFLSKRWRQTALLFLEVDSTPPRICRQLWQSSVPVIEA